jgi:hypothetical protein
MVKDGERMGVGGQSGAQGTFSSLLAFEEEEEEERGVLEHSGRST